MSEDRRKPMDKGVTNWNLMGRTKHEAIEDLDGMKWMKIKKNREFG